MSSNRNTKARLTKKLASTTSSTNTDSSQINSLASTCFCHLSNYHGCTQCQSTSAVAVAGQNSVPTVSTTVSSSSIIPHNNASKNHTSISIPKGFVEYAAAAVFDRCRLPADKVSISIIVQCISSRTHVLLKGVFLLFSKDQPVFIFDHVSSYIPLFMHYFTVYLSL
jgi:hypothetical protein